MKIMKAEGGVATVVDSDYAYINTFINFLERIVEVVNKMFSGFIDNIGKLFETLPKDTQAE